MCIYCCPRECRARKYTLLGFAWDVFMTMITCGFWLIWVFAREMRNRP